jgi:hypothetical protein
LELWTYLHGQCRVGPTGGYDAAFIPMLASAVLASAVLASAVVALALALMLCSPRVTG